MLFGALALLILSGAWLTFRRQSAGPSAAWHAPQSRREIWLGALLVLGSASPLLRLAPWTSGSDSWMPGDASSHAKVADELARFGLPHGWLESYLGGFPFGHHYPPLAWLLLAFGIRGGLTPAVAVNTLGFFAVVAAPLVLYGSAVRSGARPVFAACGACFLALVSPYNAFVGGYEVYFSAGLVSQALGLPLCMAFAAALAHGARASAALLGALAMLAHPQLAGATLLLTSVVAVIDGARGRRLATACGVAAAVATALAVYGQGLITLRVPFGWPPGFGWRQLGFGTTRLLWWLRDGDLLDNGVGTPALTALSGAAILTVSLLIRRRAPRAVLALTLAGFLAASSGPVLAQLPRLGALLLEFVQPLRVLALLPAVLALALVVALEEGTDALRGVRLPKQLASRQLPAALLAACLVLGVLGLVLPARARATQQLRAPRSGAAASSCGGLLPGDASALRGWLAALRGGSLWLDERDTALASCLRAQGLELDSAVPLGATWAVGSHVGLSWAASRQLQPERPGLAQRAEALGIRYLLLQQRPDRALPAGFVRRKALGAVELLELPSVDRAHVGCIRERWSGSDQALRQRLLGALATPESTDLLLDPARLIELRTTDGAARSEAVADRCDASLATLRVAAREPGAIEVEVTSEAPVDVAFHASAFPAWRVAIDGGPGEPAATIAPGHFSTRVAAGHHRLRATAGTMPGYGAWLLLGALTVAALAWLQPPKWLRRTAA